MLESTAVDAPCSKPAVASALRLSPRSGGSATPLETQGYLGDGRDALYYVRHSALGNVHGTVLLCGALGLEAAHAALVWTRFARTLAAAGWNAVRFDWRGSGESGGSFAEVTFDSWQRDLRGIHSWLAADNEPPLVLLGLRGGALVAARQLAAGVGDALVLWEPPASGRAHAMDVLRRKLAADYALGIVEGPLSRERYTRPLEAGRSVEVEGDLWTRPLWRSLTAVELARAPHGRRTLTVSSRTHALARPPFWLESPVLAPDVSGWFAATLSFLSELGRSSSLGVSRAERVASALIGGTRRELVTFFHENWRLVATHHLPSRPNGTAVLLGNPDFLPRSGPGGLFARICDELAAAAVHGFRVDLPCLGDSEGEMQEDDPTWTAEVRSGSMAPATLGLIAQLRSRFGIDRVVLGGLGASAATALHAFDRDPRAVAGLILLEPELGITREPRPEAPHPTLRPPVTRRLSTAPARACLHLLCRIASPAFLLRLASGRGRLARLVPVPRRLVRVLVSLAGRGLPSGTNLPLVVAWQHAAHRRIPILVVTAQGSMRERFFDRVNAALVAGAGRRRARQSVTHVRVPRTNDTFTTGGAIDRVADAIQTWVLQAFVHDPVENAEMAAFGGRRAPVASASPPDGLRHDVA